MGNESSTQKPMTNENIINLLSANAATTLHSEKSASAVTLIAYVLIAVLIIGIAYGIHKLITRYERLRNELRINRAVSLNSVRAV